MRLKTTFCAALAVFSTATCSPHHGGHTVHERRHAGIEAQWARLGPAAPDLVIPVRVGLQQMNLDRLDHWLHQVSDPDSRRYGKHWPASKVAEAFRASDDTVETVRQWLVDAGIAKDRIKLKGNRNWFTFHAPVSEIERLLKTTYFVWQHRESPIRQIACDAYILPNYLQSHVDFITPTTHFDAHVRNPRPELDPDTDTVLKSPSPGPGRKPHHVHRPPNYNGSVIEKCPNFVVPDCIRYLYNYTNPVVPSPGNTYGIVEYTPQAYLGSDLDLFFSNFSVDQIGQRPIQYSIDGGYQQTLVEDFDYNGEPDLDLQLGMALVYPINVTLYQAGDIYEGASFNNFLDAIDGTYCSYEGGDDYSQDSQYPDPNPNAGSYQGPPACGTVGATKVISTSYGADEPYFSAFYAQRQCNEYAKLGLMGVTILYSSGDSGVAGNQNKCYNGSFTPGFPVGCPYVTAVGATQIITSTDIIGARKNGTNIEEACHDVIYSGGGFSNTFGIPKYQNTTVQNWFNKYAPTYPAGAWLVIAVDGYFDSLFGTSVSAPVLGSLITGVNNARLSHGKSTVGFINPVLYKNPQIFADVIAGNNPGCGTNGFQAVPGWDPVTGLGTPDYPKMKQVFLALP